MKSPDAFHNTLAISMVCLTFSVSMAYIRCPEISLYVICISFNQNMFRWTAWSNPSSTLQSTEDFKKISFARCSSALVVKLMMWQKSQNWQFDYLTIFQYWYQHWQIYPANVYSKCYLLNRFCITFMCYFSSKQAFLVSADWDVVSYILHASQGESKHHIPKCKTNLSTWRRLNLELEPCRAVQMIRIDCKQICHTRPIDHPRPQQAGPSTTWSWSFVKKSRS